MSNTGGRLLQGRLGYCAFTPEGGSPMLIPVHAWTLQARRNRITGDPVGNTFSTNWNDGMVTSRFTAQIMTRKGTSEWASTGFIDHFLNRVVTDGLDDTVPFTITCSNGSKANVLTNAKPESFVLTVAKGSPIGLEVTFVAPSAPTDSDARATDLASAYQYTVDATKLMMFDSAVFYAASDVTGLGAATTPVKGMYNVQLTYANNHIVNGELDGTLHATSYDAGLMKCSASFTVRAFSGASGDEAPFSNEAAMRCKLALGGGAFLALDMASIVLETDLDANANPGASYLTWQGMVQGSVIASTPHQPLAVVHI